MFAGDDVFNEDSARLAADASHFAEDLQWILDVMESEAADDELELLRWERQILRIADAEGNVGDAALLRAFAGDREHGVREVNADRFPSDTGKCFGDIAGAGGDVENPLAACQVSGSD